MTEKGLVVYCKCIHRNLVSSESRTALLQGLHDIGFKTVVVDDLCGLAARRDPLLKTWARITPLVIIACYERAIRWLFDMGGAPLPVDTSVKILNPRSLPPEKIMNALRTEKTDTSEAPSYISGNKERQEPWFPVIDRDRCRSCKLCFNFCLFGVYTVDDQDRVRVSQPDNCKNNCPACARVCPERAIIFPKIDQSPINGDEVDESKISADPVRLDLFKKTDVYSMLRNRGRRFSPDPRQPVNMLEILHKQLDIPMEVLKALSPTDLDRIKKKASSSGKSNDT